METKIFLMQKKFSIIWWKLRKKVQWSVTSDAIKICVIFRSIFWFKKWVKNRCKNRSFFDCIFRLIFDSNFDSKNFFMYNFFSQKFFLKKFFCVVYFFLHVVKFFSLLHVNDFRQGAKILWMFVFYFVSSYTEKAEI